MNGKMALGAGTVLNVTQRTQPAGGAGTSIPNTDEKVIHYSKQKGLVSIPGAMTPSEMVEVNVGALKGISPKRPGSQIYEEHHVTVKPYQFYSYRGYQPG
jgi:2-keto-3-deoxy-6-phosphogluconate aldolase